MPTLPQSTRRKLSLLQLAEELGNVKSANMVMLGAFIKKTNMVSLWFFSGQNQVKIA